MTVWAGAIQPSHRFSFLSVTSMSDSEFLLVYIQGDCVSRGHTAIPQILFESVTIHQWAISNFGKNNSVWLCVQGPYSHPTHLILITYMDISELFQTFDKCNFVRLCVQGPYSHPTDFILISYIHELFQTFGKYNSLWLCVQGPHSHTTDLILITYISEPHVCILKWNKQPLLWPNLSQTRIVIIGYPSKQSSLKP